MSKKTFAIASLGGVVATSIDVALLAALVELHTPIAVSAFAGACAGAAAGYVMNKHVAFRDGTPVSLRQVARFAAVALCTAAMMAAAMHVAVHWAGIPYLLAKLGCAVTVFCLWSYPAQRRFVFPRLPAPRLARIFPAVSPGHSLSFSRNLEMS